MTIAFTCPHCGQQTDVADRFAGQTGPCSACGQTIRIPTPGTQSFLPPQRPRRLAGCLTLAAGGCAFLLCLGIVPAVMNRNIPGAWNAMRRSECRSNLEQIATAVGLYEADFGCLPPAYTTDSEGNRLHSWRTLILPYLGEQALYDSMHLDEPWDSPSNRLWHDTPVDVFQCPADSTGSSTDSSYVMIVGGEAVFDGKPRKAVEVTDGTSKTILVIEMAGSKIHWMEPKDLGWEETDFTLGGAKSVSSEHEGGAHVMMCDGTVEFLTSGTPAADIRAMATRAGGESVSGLADVVEEDFSN